VTCQRRHVATGNFAVGVWIANCQQPPYFERLDREPTPRLA
jgi:hypothetical protein